MSKRGGRRRKRGVVDPPRSDDLEYSPPESVKKPRLIPKTDSGVALESSSKDVTSSQNSCPSSQIAATASRLAACDKAPCLWSVEEVEEFMGKSGLPKSVAEAFKEHEIHGRHLLELSQEDLKEMGIKSIGVQKDVLTLLKSLVSQQVMKLEKVFNDPIHGHIELHPLMVKIIDTPQFQRLRYIKQLGGCYWVFPGAAHNRFEHSIGVGFLAGELVEILQRKQPELDITDKDVLCVKIAGLCHDLGHGPFSHLFDVLFIPRVRPEIEWKHERASVMMFEYLLESNDLKPEFERYGLNETDIKFIEEQIAGPLASEMSSQLSNWSYLGRPESKSFLYEIVANKRNGIDVDKWDYFARDCHCLGIPNNFDMRRFMKFARVIDVKNRRQICARDKEVGNLYEMFHTRNTLHRRAYQHKTSNAVEQMLTEALALANDHIRLPGKHGPVRMSEAIYDPCAYTRLNDSVVHQILVSSDPKLEEAKRILQRIERRELYKCLGQTQMEYKIDKGRASEMVGQIVESLSPEELGGLPALKKEDLLVDVVTFDYGMKEKNPIDHVRFYVKDQPHKPVQVRKDQVSQMLPEKFMEQSIRVYCRKTDPDSIKAARKLFLMWCRKTSCITPRGGELNLDISDIGGLDTITNLDLDDFTPYSTPMKNEHGSRSGGSNPEESSRTPTNTSEEVVQNLNKKFSSVCE